MPRWGASALYDFTSTEDSTTWGPDWLPLHYLERAEIQGGQARLLVPPGLSTTAPNQPMPVFLLDHDCATVRQRLTFTVSDESLRPGVLLRGTPPHDYVGVTIEGRQLVLAQYGRTDRTVLSRQPISGLQPETRYHLEVVHRDDRLHAALWTGTRATAAELDAPLRTRGKGSVGILALHPLSLEPAVLSVLRYRVDAKVRFKPTPPRKMYGFSGVPMANPDGSNRVRLLAAANLPAEIAFEWSKAPDGSQAITGAFEPAQGPPYTMDTWVDFPAGTTLYWRTRLRSASSGTVRPSEWSSVKSLRSAGAVRMAAASCAHLWRKPAYLGLRNVQEAAGKPLRALVYQGDLGYPNNSRLSCYAAAEDFFADRFTRFLSDPCFRELRRTTGIVFTQDDHDYGPMNNAARDTVEPWAIDLGGRMFQESSSGYHDFRIGDVHCLTLDVRRYADQPSADPNADISRLGSAQLNWLESIFAASNAELFVLFSAGIFASRRHSLDSFLQGWTREYERILTLSHDVQLGGKRVVILSGDAHGLRVHYHPDPAGRPQAGGVPVVEFICSGLEAQTWSTAVVGDPTLDAERNVMKRSGLGLIEVAAPTSGDRTVELRAIAARRVLRGEFDLFPPLVLPFRPGPVAGAPVDRLVPHRPSRIVPQE